MKQGYVTVSIAPLYLKADKTSCLVDEALYGNSVSIIKELKDFYKIKTFYNYEGYVEKKCVTTCKNAVDTYNNINKMVVVKSYADIKSGTSVQSSIVKSVTKGAIVGVYKEPKVNGYKKLCLIGKDIGYIKEEFLGKYIEPTTNPQILNEEKTRNNIVKNAMGYLKTQYRWGGKTNLGIDCSGLCFMSYLLEGTIIFRDAKIKRGFPVKEIDMNLIKKGDLIFFKGHVAIYMEKGKFIHSSYKNGGVYINSLWPKDKIYSKQLHNSILKVGSIF